MIMPYRWGSLQDLFIVAALLFVSGCAEEPDSSPAPEREVVHHEAEGRVVSILENSRLIQVAHGDIEGVMPAMTMPFEFRADSIRAAVTVGDSVHFRIASNGIDNWIVEIAVVE